MAFFDGASIIGGLNCGAGGIIKCSESLVYICYFNCGEGAHTKAELLGAWATLTLAKHLNTQNIHILRDSKVIIDWLNHKRKLQAIDIEGWKHRILELSTTFQGICFQHIYMEFNEEAHLLSKHALLEPKGRLPYFTWEGGTVRPPFHIEVF